MVWVSLLVVLALGEDLPYCSRPDFAPLNPPFDGAHLARVVICFRHGDRTPTAPLPPYSDDAVWDCPNNALQGVNADSLLAVRYRPNVEPLKGTCGLGQLTPRGVQQWVDYGSQIRPFLLQHGLISEGDPVAGELNIHSSPVPRTLQSLSALLSSLYPMKSSAATFPTEIQDLKTSPITFPFHCMSYFDEIERALKASPQAASFNATMQSFIDDASEALGVNATTAKHILDYTTDAAGAMLCHGMSLPPFFNNESVWRINSWDTTYLSQGVLLPQYKPYFASPLLHVIRRMLTGEDEVQARGRVGVVVDCGSERCASSAMNVSQQRQAAATDAAVSPARLSLISGHDITVIQLVVALLGKVSSVWPAYGASVRIEVYTEGSRRRGRQSHTLFSTRNSSGATVKNSFAAASAGEGGGVEHVRAIFNEEVLPLPCMNGGTTCTLSSFLAMLEPFMGDVGGRCRL